MIVLGIGDSHEAHACLIRDGELLAVMAEERLSRLKSDMGYPRLSIDAVLDITGIAPEEIDVVAFGGRWGFWFQTLYKIIARFSVHDYVRQCHEYWKPILLEGKKLTPFDDFELFRHKNPDLEADPYFPFLEQARNAEPSEWDDIGHRIRCDVVFEHIGLPADRVVAYRHEDCHKAYGYYSAPRRPGDALVLTVEGGGDDSSATVSTMRGGELTEHWASNDVMIGRLYRYVTLILGMKPTQHEYKVMGLAPYGTAYHGERSLEFFRQVNRVEGTKIVRPDLVKDMYFAVKDALEGDRFDGIAWGIQKWLEETLNEWIANLVEAYGLDKVILSGGVAQNIKALKAISELDQVAEVWAGPISGDGSLGVGAAWLACRERSPEAEIKGLPSTYLGRAYDGAAIERALRASGATGRFDVIERVGPRDIARWIADGRIVARFAGRMEFGQRALGNRSILADPRRHESVERINRQVKFRDFWMPFTPSVLHGDAEEMLVNPKGIFSPFMTMAFDVRPEHHGNLAAVLHPADKTMRPQMLRAEANPDYYALIDAFKNLTGVGAVLNTSFNLHGEAIVESPDDAIDTFERCGLDILVLGDLALSRVGDAATLGVEADVAVNSATA